MSDPDDKVLPPAVGKTQRIAVSTTGALTALAAGLIPSGWLRIKAITADVDFRLDVATGTQVVKDATGSGDTLGYTLAAGQAEDFYNPGGMTHVNWDASAAGFLIVMRAGPDRVRDGG